MATNPTRSTHSRRSGYPTVGLEGRELRLVPSLRDAPAESPSPHGEDRETCGLSDLREALETHAAGLAALRRSDADIAEMALANDQMQREIASGDIGLAGDERFHRAILTAAGSPILADLLEQIQPSPRSPSPPAHHFLFEAIVHHERDEAAWLMLEHVGSHGVLNRGDVR
jgi:DNA-binding FadR family transcriptional regulator